MSDVKNDRRQWFLRTNKDAVFGPVASSMLVQWAEQGRVLPGHEVSEDNVTWVPARALDFLDMRWYIDEGHGKQQGPLNRVAAETLLKKGKLGPQAKLLEVSQQPPPPAVEVQSDDLTAKVKLSPLELLHKELSEAKEQLVELKATHASFLREQASAKEAWLQELEQVQTQNARFAEQLSAYNVNADTARLALEAELAATKNALQQAQNEAVQLRTQLGELTARTKELVAWGDTNELLNKELQERLDELEAELTALLNEANTRDMQYQTRIAELERLGAQTPEETARFLADQDAIYQLISSELEELSNALEYEKQQMNDFRSRSTQRQECLIERRQTLLKYMADSPRDMTRKVARIQGVDPQIARLRAEQETLRVTYQRELQLAKTKEREWQEKFRTQEAIELRLRSQVAANEKDGQRVQELEERVFRREQELKEERQRHEDARKQNEMAMQALLARVEELEGDKPLPATHDFQAREARNVKLPPWMSLKR